MALGITLEELNKLLEEKKKKIEALPPPLTAPGQIGKPVQPTAAQQLSQAFEPEPLVRLTAGAATAPPAAPQFLGPGAAQAARFKGITPSSILPQLPSQQKPVFPGTDAFNRVVNERFFGTSDLLPKAVTGATKALFGPLTGPVVAAGVRGALGLDKPFMKRSPAFVEQLEEVAKFQPNLRERIIERGNQPDPYGDAWLERRRKEAGLPPALPTAEGGRIP